MAPLVVLVVVVLVVFDAEDEEFNDIIDEQGALVGEKFLMAEFVADPEEAKS